MQIEQVKSKNIQTVCKDCVFATYVVEDDHPKQTGCQVGRDVLLANNGANILHIEDEKRDYFLIQDRVCNMCRGPQWELEMKHRKVKDLIKQARQEINLKCTCLIYLGPHDLINEAAKSMLSLDAQKHKADSVIIVNANPTYDPSTFLDFFRKQDFTTPWSMEYVVELQTQEILDVFYGDDEQSKDQLEKEAYYRCIDIGARKAKTIYYAVIRAGDVLPSHYLQDIDKAINDDMIRVLALEPEHHTGLFMHRALHSQIGGNKERPSIDKIKDQSKVQKCPNLVLPVNQIVKNFE
jgi:hypothetical protein